MGRIVVTEYVSVDGVIQAPGGGEEEFPRGGWTFGFDRGSEGDRFKYDETFGCEALLLGRVTYEAFADAWPTMEGEFADRFNSMPKYVVSATLRDPAWTNSTVLAGDPVEEARELKRTLAGDAVVHGSGRLARALLEHDLVDELRLMVYPIVVGAGQRLFGETSAAKRLRLLESRRFDDGIALLVYAP